MVDEDIELDYGPLVEEIPEKKKSTEKKNISNEGKGKGMSDMYKQIH
jgi:hypothetical protein